MSSQQQFELVVTSESVTSTDERFTIDNLGLGDSYAPLDAYFKSANGEKIRRDVRKNERKISNRTLPSLACQTFKEQLAALSLEERQNFPICQYSPNENMISGIYTSVDEFNEKHGKTYERLTYDYDNSRQFVFYCWNIFSTLIFVQECLKHFGEPKDQFVLIYQQKDEEQPEPSQFNNRFSSMLIESKNLIFSGAPGTGKSYLAKEIAADIISNGNFDDYSLLEYEQKQQVEFVQFHPSYDYSDFVEGLRPKVNDDGTMGFELRDGIFKKFVARARKNYENSQKSQETTQAKQEELKRYVFIIDEINRGEISKIFGELFFCIDPGYRGKAGEISTQYANLHSDSDDKFYIPENVYIIGTMNDIDRSVDSFDFAMRRRFRFIKLRANDKESLEMLSKLKNKELQDEAIRRMSALNEAISDVEDLNENYHIGASYFLKLTTLDGDDDDRFDQLWTDYLQPLLQEYIQGMYDEDAIMHRFAIAYGYQPTV